MLCRQYYWIQHCSIVLLYILYIMYIIIKHANRKQKFIIKTQLYNIMTGFIFCTHQFNSISAEFF